MPQSQMQQQREVESNADGALKDNAQRDPLDLARLAAELALMADLLELKDENPFKINSYRGAARAVETFEGTLIELIAASETGKVKGIGKQLAAALREATTNQQLPGLSDVISSLPPELPELFEISGLGPKKIRTLYEQLSIDSLSALESACLSGTVAALKGFGTKSQDKILEGIAQRRSYRERLLLSKASDAFEKVASFAEPSDLLIVGELKRRLPVVSHIELLNFGPAGTVEEDARLALAALSKTPPPLHIISGNRKLRAFELLYATGPAHFLAWLQECARARPGVE